MAKQNYKDQSSEELKVNLEDTRKEIFELINDAKTTKKNESPHQIREKRKDIARVLTLLRTRELEAAKQGNVQ